MKRCIALIGGGLAAQRCAEALRRGGGEQPIVLVCAEHHRPYSRPPLSKELLLAGERAEDAAYFKLPAWYHDHEIELRPGVRATGLDLRERAVLLSDGRRIRADQVLIATGAQPRTLPQLAGRTNVSSLYTIADAHALRRAIIGGGALAIIGAGFIGQEVAAAARSLGAEVTIVDFAAAPMASLLGERLGSWFADFHRGHGVRLLLGRTIAAAIGDRAIRALELSDGTVIRCDHVLVAIGVRASIDWLQGTGLPGLGALAGAIPTDDRGATSIPGVFAAGDAAAPFDALLGRHVPCAHWEAAGRLGAGAGRAMLGLQSGAAPASSFWSDQYGTRFQYIGHAPLADSLEIDGDLDAPSFAAIFRRAGTPVAALLAGRPQQLPAMRRLIASGV